MIPGLGRSPGGGNGNLFNILDWGKSHGQRSLEGYSPWGHKESDMTEHTNTLESSGAVGDKLTSMGFPLVLVPLEFLTLIVVHAEPLNLSITLQVFVPCHWLPWKRLLMGFVLKSCESLHLPASKFGTSGYESKKSCCFFSLFIFLLFFKRWSDVFHARMKTGSLSLPFLLL